MLEYNTYHWAVDLTFFTRILRFALQIRSRWIVLLQDRLIHYYFIITNWVDSIDTIWIQHLPLSSCHVPLFLRVANVVTHWAGLSVARHFPTKSNDLLLFYFHEKGRCDWWEDTILTTEWSSFSSSTDVLFSWSDFVRSIAITYTRTTKCVNCYYWILWKKVLQYSLTTY